MAHREFLSAGLAAVVDRACTLRDAPTSATSSPRSRAQFFDEIDDDELSHRADDMAAAAVAHLRFGHAPGKPGETLVDIRTSPDRPHSILSVITDDAPFMVDTIRLALDRLGTRRPSDGAPVARCRARRRRHAHDGVGDRLDPRSVDADGDQPLHARRSPRSIEREVRAGVADVQPCRRRRATAMRERGPGGRRRAVRAPRRGAHGHRSRAGVQAARLADQAALRVPRRGVATRSSTASSTS